MVIHHVKAGNSLSTNLYNVNRCSVNYQITIIAMNQVFHTSVYHPKSCILQDPPGMQFTIIFHVIYNIISCKLLDLSTLSKSLSLSPCNLPCNLCMSIYMVKYIIIFGKKCTLVYRYHDRLMGHVICQTKQTGTCNLYLQRCSGGGEGVNERNV